jgi:tetratricopeptide (TPR) repeat protein
VALLWTVHPLQTESVTFVIQRTESLMGLFYLLTLYCFIRGVDRSGFMPDVSGINPDLQIARGKGAGPSNSQPSTLSSRLWILASVLACLLGMATKEVMVTAPLVVLLYDRTFMAGTFREAWRRRGGWYLGLFGTWLLLGFLVVHMGGKRSGGAGFGLGVTPWAYALTQCRALVLYLRLSVWPHPLVLDYGTGVVRQFTTVAPQAIVLTLLAGGTIFMLRYRPALGFLCAWFFLILAPSSSVVPLVAQTMAEHRMYLPLATVIVLVVLGLYAWMGRRSLIVFAAAAVGLGCATFERNKDYRSALAIWSDTATKFPESARAHYNLGFVLMGLGRSQEAIPEYEAALRIDPNYAQAHNNLGEALATIAGRLSDAISHYEAALQIAPDDAKAHSNLGNALLNIPGRLPDAIAEYETALRLQPDDAGMHRNLGHALLNSPGRLPDAMAEFKTALRLQPDSAEAQDDLGDALAKIPGRLPDAISHYEAALRINPDSAPAHYNLGTALEKIPDRLPDAISHYETALRLDPDYAKAHNNLGAVLAKIPGRLPDAVSHYEAALRIQPDFAEAHNNLGIALSTIPGRLPDAISHFEAALKINPDYADAHYNLGVALTRTRDRLPNAIAHFEAALKINPGLVGARYNLGTALLQQGRPAAACEQYEEALKLKPDYAQGHVILGVTLARMGRLDEALTQFETALQINPDDPSAQKYLEMTQAMLLKNRGENSPERPAP